MIAVALGATSAGSPNPGNQSVPHLAGIFRIAGQVPSEYPFLIQNPRNEDRGNPAGAMQPADPQIFDDGPEHGNETPV